MITCTLLKMGLETLRHNRGQHIPSTHRSPDPGNPSPDFVLRSLDLICYDKSDQTVLCLMITNGFILQPKLIHSTLFLLQMNAYNALLTLMFLKTIYQTCTCKNQIVMDAEHHFRVILKSQRNIINSLIFF